jgi:S-DNA-T family DNA segregation ATPase FtsK/SpoIIIE
MLFEIISSTIFGGISLKAYLSKSGEGSDSRKIQKLFTLTGLNVKDGNQTYTTQLLKKKTYEWGTEYRYRIPQGRCFEDYVAKQKVFEAGINNRVVKVEFKDLRWLKIDRNIISNIRSLYTRKLTDRKEIELSYDGVLKIRVYNEPLPEKIPWKKDYLKKDSYSVLIGFNQTDIFHHDFDKRKHLIIAGVPGSGKSAIIKTIITTLTMQKPDDVTFSLIDLKEGAAFTRFKNMKQVVNFGTNEAEAKEIFKDVQKRMQEDYKKIVRNGFEDIAEAKNPKRHFLIIDEAADLVDDRNSMDVLTDIVRKGRGAGYYVIYSTQYPSKEAIPMQIKRNIPSRLSFVLDSSSASMTVLDGAGAESLPEIPGRGIYKNTKQTTIQTPFMSNSLIDELICPYIIDKGGSNGETVKRETREDIVIFEKTRFS